MKIFHSILFVLFVFICQGQDDKQSVFSLWQEAEALMIEDNLDLDLALTKVEDAYKVAREKD